MYVIKHENCLWVISASLLVFKWHFFIFSHYITFLPRNWLHLQLSSTMYSQIFLQRTQKVAFEQWWSLLRGFLNEIDIKISLAGLRLAVVDRWSLLTDGRCWQVVVVKRCSLTKVWMYFHLIHFNMKLKS